MPDKRLDAARGRHGATGGSLRADAARNQAQIRAAALTAFHGRGLSTPLEEIASAAGVSKATIYNRFGGRTGLIEAVIDQLVASDLQKAIEAAHRAPDPWQRLADWVTARRDLQYRQPAFTDVMLGDYAESPVVARLATQAATVTRDAVRSAHDAGVIAADFTAADLFWSDVANGLALRTLTKPRRADYDRRTTQFLASLRPHP